MSAPSIINEVQPLPDTTGIEVVPTEVEVTSPVCYAREASDTYAGYASTGELLAFLREVLEVERADARIAARTASESSFASLTTLMGDVHRDGARWCAMLLKWITHLGGTPSGRTGISYEESLAVSDLLERVAFINQGQECVVRKIREILPRIRDDRMHADIREMLISHEFNISRSNNISALRSE